MRTFTAAITLALAALANAAAVRRSDPPTEPGLLTFRNAECSYADAQYEGDFIPFSLFSGDKCLYLALFRSVIVYTPDGGPLPYNIFVDSYLNGPCGDTTKAVKLNTTNTCIKLTDDSAPSEFEYLLKA